LIAALAAGCSNSSNPTPEPTDTLFEGKILVHPTVQDDVTWYLMARGKDAAGDDFVTLLDTGSVYFFLADKGNSDGLSCTAPNVFSFVTSGVFFCPQEQVLTLMTPDDKFVEVLSEPLAMGDAYFEIPGGGFRSFIGLSANRTTWNRPGISLVTEQLAPDHLSFAFPDGLKKTGYFQFAPLDSPSPDAMRIPLVDPGTQGYGYTVHIETIEYVIDDKVHSSFVTKSDGIYLEDGSESNKVAERMTGFIDTGTANPIFPLDGDHSLLGPNAELAPIKQDPKAPQVDEVRFTLVDEDGKDVVISGDMKPFQTFETATRALTMSALEEKYDMKHFGPVIGLATVGQFDFQFDFADGRATHIVLSPR